MVPFFHTNLQPDSPCPDSSFERKGSTLVENEGYHSPDTEEFNNVYGAYRDRCDLNANGVTRLQHIEARVMNS
jgi:hypothetical protein